jgi:hypothetical protein
VVWQLCLDFASFLPNSMRGIGDTVHGQIHVDLTATECEIWVSSSLRVVVLKASCEILGLAPVSEEYLP